MIARLAADVLDVLLPPTCAVCRRPVPRRTVVVCAGCRAGLRNGTPVHRRLGTGEAVLPAWGGRATGADMVALVGAWKYRGRRAVAATAVRLVRRAHRTAVARDGPVDWLVPIPLHRSRRRERGFNQAEELALGLAATGAGRAVRLLARRRDTAQQARLPARSSRRRANVAGAFHAVTRPASVPPRVVLVDDLVTTGATALAAAQALRAAGWEVVRVVACGLATGRETGVS